MRTLNTTNHITEIILFYAKRHSKIRQRLPFDPLTPQELSKSFAKYKKIVFHSQAEVVMKH